MSPLQFKQVVIFFHSTVIQCYQPLVNCLFLWKIYLLLILPDCLTNLHQIVSSLKFCLSPGLSCVSLCGVLNYPWLYKYTNKNSRRWNVLLWVTMTYVMLPTNSWYRAFISIRQILYSMFMKELKFSMVHQILCLQWGPPRSPRYHGGSHFRPNIAIIWQNSGGNLKI